MTDMHRELAEVVRYYGSGFKSDTAGKFLADHHAEIAQNAEAAKRLRALEMAMGELESHHRGWHQEIRGRAEEIMRGES